jgi:hypothetical protein
VSCASVQARSAPTRYGELTCRQYYEAVKKLQKQEETLAIQLSETWLYGYVSAQRGVTTMDPEVFVRFSMDVMDTCIKNLDSPLLEVVNKVPFRSTGEY